ncbi:hypothetical protein IFR05_016447 [Cadophora sp. M221]|nr:hypothetical protein IFR05_016447 [Cadophora sp. M221]
MDEAIYSYVKEHIVHLAEERMMKLAMAAITDEPAHGETNKHERMKDIKARMALAESLALDVWTSMSKDITGLVDATVRGYMEPTTVAEEIKVADTVTSVVGGTTEHLKLELNGRLKEALGERLGMCNTFSLAEVLG